MNLELQPPLSQNYPETITGSLERSDTAGLDFDPPDAVRLCFNRRGSYIAVGHDSGVCHVWDLVTRTIAVRLDGHSSSISCLGWSRDSRNLLTTAEDGTCAIWDLADGSRALNIHFSAPILNASFHPRKSDMVLVATIVGPATLVKWRPGQEEPERIPLPLPPLYAKVGGAEKPDSATVAIFDHRGDYIIVGTRMGRVVILQTTDLEVVLCEKIVSAALRQIRIDRQGRSILVNATDKIMRLYSWDREGGALHSSFRMQGHVDRYQWNQCGFSGDGEYIFGGSAHLGEHNIFLYDSRRGNLVKTLEGPRETVIDIAWHPYLTLMITVSSAGRVYIWSIEREESWAAYAPDFVELEENVMYIEPEDEFDTPAAPLLTEEEGPSGEAEDATVDVTTVEKTYLYGDSSGDEDDLTAFYIPVRL